MLRGAAARAQVCLLAVEAETRYGADLEAFVEKRFGKRFPVRLTGSNLLNAKKDERFNKFDDGIDQANLDFDEYELEPEEAGQGSVALSAGPERLPMAARIAPWPPVHLQ